MANKTGEADSLPDKVLRAAISTLAPLEQQILDLVYFRSHTQTQVAELLAVSRHSVAKSVAAALRGIGTYIEVDRTAPHS
jgi:DNA-directed RNA polymerase specialized sigma subunit